MHNEEGDIIAVFCFSPENMIFKGHFPGNPILSGIAQLESVKYMIEQTLVCKCSLQQSSSIKFFQPILPNQEFIFVISFKNDGNNFIDIICRGTTGESKAKCTEIIARYKIDGTTQKK